MTASQRASLPDFFPPRTAALVWFLVALCLAALDFTWTTRIPITSTGVASYIAADWQTDTSSQSPAHDCQLLLLFPSDGPALEPGDKVFLRRVVADRPLVVHTIPTEPRLLDASILQRQFGLKPALVGTLKLPVFGALVSSEDLPANWHVSGLSLFVQRQTGTRRLADFLLPESIDTSPWP